MTLATREEILKGEWTHPVERCPKCGAQMLVNRFLVKWCSFTRCDYVAPNKRVA